MGNASEAHRIVCVRENDPSVVLLAPLFLVGHVMRTFSWLCLNSVITEIFNSLPDGSAIVV
jgi:hypothetical protein